MTEVLLVLPFFRVSIDLFRVHCSKNKQIQEQLQTETIIVGNFNWYFFQRGTLQEEIDRLATKGEFISEHRLLRLFRGICDGVRALHQASPVPLAHRDIKPGNVLLSDNGTPIIMDFGSMAPARLEVKGRSQALAVQDLAAEK